MYQKYGSDFFIYINDWLISSQRSKAANEHSQLEHDADDVIVTHTHTYIYIYYIYIYIYIYIYTHMYVYI